MGNGDIKATEKAGIIEAVRSDKVKLTATVLMFLLWMGIIFTTVMKYTVASDIISPLIVLCSVIIILRSGYTIGRYWPVVRWFMVGVAMWFVADVVWLFREYIFTGNYIFDTISDNLYLIPDYMYLIGIVMYARYRFYRRDLQMILAHIFILSVMAFIILSKVFDFFTEQSVRIDAGMIDIMDVFLCYSFHNDLNYNNIL